MRMIIKIDGNISKEFSRDYTALIKFLKENTHGGKVSPHVEVFKASTLKADNEAFHWIMSTFDLDRDLEQVDPDGWELENYLRNPVVLWSHDYRMPAIGHAENVNTENKVLSGDIIFNPKEADEFGYGIGQRVKAGSIRTGSVGFRVDEVEFCESEKTESRIIYRKQELLEFSICNIPANPFAVMTDRKETKANKSLFERIRLAV